MSLESMIFWRTIRESIAFFLFDT